MYRTSFVMLTVTALAACAGDGTSPTALDVTDGSSGPNGNGANGRRDENFDCVGTFTGSFTNVFVPEGRTCTLENAAVSGNVLARDGSTLYVLDTRVDGNIDGVEAAVVQVRGGTVGGSIQIQDGDSPGALGAAVYGGTVLTQGNIQVIKMRTGSIRIDGVELRKGNIKVEENQVALALDVTYTRVAQNIQVFKNEGPGDKRVVGNQVGQVLQCKENRAPFTGGPNSAAEAEDQCF